MSVLILYCPLHLGKEDVERCYKYLEPVDALPGDAEGVGLVQAAEGRALRAPNSSPPPVPTGRLLRRSRLMTAEYGRRRRENWSKLKQERFRLSVRNLFPLRTPRHWSRVQRAFAITSPEHGAQYVTGSSPEQLGLISHLALL